MGQAYSTKPKQNKKNRSIQPGNFIIVVDPDDIFESSVLEEPSILAVNASYTTIPLGKTMSKESFPNIINQREEEKRVNAPDNLSNNLSLGLQSQSRNKKPSKHKKYADSEIELSSLSLSQQQKRDEKIKKVCTCKFIITSDISSHEETLKQKLKPSESHISRFSERISDDNDICRNISEQVSEYSINLPNSLNKRGDLLDQLATEKFGRDSDKLAKVQTPETPNSPATAFYKYENSKITMLSSVLRVPTQERLNREFGGPLPEKTSHKEMLSRQSSDTANDVLEDKDDYYTCPFCGATASSLLTPENFARLSSLKSSKTFFTKPTADDDSFKQNRNDKPIHAELLNLRETTKQKPVQGELAKSKLLKKSKASSANFVNPTRDDATSARSREESSNIFSEKLLSKQYTPEKLYISLKRTARRPRKSKEQDKFPPKSIMKTPYDCPRTAECCKEEPLRQDSEPLLYKSEETTDDSSSAIYEPVEVKCSRDSLIKPSSKPNDSFDSFNQNLKRLHEKKVRSVPEKSQGGEFPKITSSHASAKSFQSKLDKLTLHSVNKSSFRPLKVSYAPDIYREPPSKEETLNEDRLEKPSKIIVEISGSVLPKSIMQQLTKSRLKTYISSQGTLPEELLKPLSNLAYQDSSKQTKEVTNNQGRHSHKSSVPKKVVLPPPELKHFDTSQQQFENPPENYSKLATNQLTQTNDTVLPKAMKKHLKKSQIFLSTTKPQPLKNVSQTLFEELHKYPKQVRVPRPIIEKPVCCRKFQQHRAEKLAEEEGSTGSTSRESIQSQASDLSEVSGKSFASDASDASQLSTSIKNTSSKRKRDLYDYRTVLKKKNMLKHVKEHLSKIKEVSPNGSHRSLSSSASDVSLTLKEKQLLDKQSLSDQSLRRGQDPTRHKSHFDEFEMQKKQLKQMASQFTSSKENDLSTSKPAPKQRLLGRYKFSEVTKDQDSINDFVKHRSRASHISLEEEPSSEDFREPSAFQQNQFQEIETEGVRKATGEPETSSPSSPSPLSRRPSILKQNGSELKSNKVFSPVTFRRACHTEIHYPDESDPEVLMVCTSYPSDSELSQILEEPSEEEIEEIKPTKLLYQLRSSENFFCLPSSASFYDLWKYDEDPSTKFVQILEEKYNRKFNTINELIEKPPKQLILFIKKGELVETPDEVIEPIKHTIDYKEFLNSMTSGV